MIQISPARGLRGVLTMPGDKSISHRALLFGALAKGKTTLRGLSGGEDVRSTRRCLQNLGVQFEEEDKLTYVHGVGLRGIRQPATSLDCGNSGSTMRMLMGLLAAQNFEATLVGDASLSRRPMNRVADPLGGMGARFEMNEGGRAPVRILQQSTLRGIEYELPVASAQVKTALLVAGLYAAGITRLTGKIGSRDHTERLLNYFGVPITQTEGAIALVGGRDLKPVTLDIPGDISSAAFWLAASALIPGARVSISNLLLNPTRIGFLEALRRMGANLSIRVEGEIPEPVGTVTVLGGAPLQAIQIGAEEVPSLVDEIPMLAVLATYAKGTTIIRGAEELRVKESDRIQAVAENLRRMGAEVETFPDGLAVRGPQPLNGADLDSFDDHRIAMAFAIGALGARGTTRIARPESVAISYPAFFDTLEKLSRV